MADSEEDEDTISLFGEVTSHCSGNSLDSIPRKDNERDDDGHENGNSQDVLQASEDGDPEGLISLSDPESYSNDDTMESSRRFSDISDLPDLEREVFEKAIYMRQERQEEQLIRHQQWRRNFLERKDSLLDKIRRIMKKKDTD